MTISDNDKRTVRELARRVGEIAENPRNYNRLQSWNALRDLRPERPMFLVDHSTFRYILYTRLKSVELTCENPFMRDMELNLRMQILHAGLGDDFVVSPYVEIPWAIEEPDYGVPVKIIRPDDTSIAYSYEFPIRGEDDAKRLKARAFSCDREGSLHKKRVLEDIFDGALDVRLSGPAYMRAGLTKPLHTLIGIENMMLWPYDDPGLFHFLMNYMCEDLERFFAWLREERLLSLNNGGQYSGAGSPGFTEGLPSAGYSEETGVRLCDQWCWAESQETSCVSPSMYKEFILPYLKRLTDLFGYVYYGCCEPVHDIIRLIKESFPNLRAVSVSPWSDKERTAAELENFYVYSNKPMPSFLSGQNPDWAEQKKELAGVLKAVGRYSCCLEIILRDVYDVGNDAFRFRDWAAMIRSNL